MAGETALEDRKDRYHHGDLRRALLEAARELIVERGVAETSMRQIAVRAGVSPRAPYHHFPDKLSLLAEVAREGFERLGEKMAPHLEIADPAVRITEIGIAYVEFSQQSPGDFQAMYWDELSDPDNFPDREKAAQGPFRYLLDALQALAGRRLPDEALLPTALRAWSTVHGFAALLGQGVFRHMLPEADPAALTRDVVERCTRSLEVELETLGR